MKKSMLVCIMSLTGIFCSGVSSKSLQGARNIAISGDGGSDLPPGLTAVEYLYCTDANPFINTLYADSDMVFEMGFLNSTQNAKAFGSLVGSTSRFCFPASPADFFYFGGSSSVRTGDSALTLNEYHDVSMSKGGIYIDGILRTSTISSAADVQSSVLLSVNGWNYNNRNEGRGAMHIYYFRVSKSGIKILDLIPVRFTNELGQTEGAMYDRVSGELFRNQGTGSFIIGPDK